MSAVVTALLHSRVVPAAARCPMNPLEEVVWLGMLLAFSDAFSVMGWNRRRELTFFFFIPRDQGKTFADTYAGKVLASFHTPVLLLCVHQLLTVHCCN